MRDKNISKKGFTLIELLVVIAIVSLLSSIVFSNLNEARKKARDAERISELNSLANAIALYQSDHEGAYPIDACSWVVGRDDWSDAFKAALQPYLSPLPKDPINIRAHRYCAYRLTWEVNPDNKDPACDQKYGLWSTLEINNPSLLSCGYTNYFFKIFGPI